MMKRTYGGGAVDMREAQPLKESVRTTKLSCTISKKLVRRSILTIMPPPRRPARRQPPPPISAIALPLDGCRIRSCSSGSFPLDEVLTMVVTERDIRFYNQNQWFPTLGGIRRIERREGDIFRVEYGCACHLELTSPNPEILDERLSCFMPSDQVVPAALQRFKEEITEELGRKMQDMKQELKGEIGQVKEETAGLNQRMIDGLIQFSSLFQEARQQPN